MLQLGDPSEEATALERILLEACEALGLAHWLQVHNPNQDFKAHVPWFDTYCHVIWHTWHCSCRLFGATSQVTQLVRAAFCHACHVASQHEALALPELLKYRPC